MKKPAMMLKWADEPNARPIDRADAARNIRANRRMANVKVMRKHGETYIASVSLGVACCIFRATQAGA